MEFTAYFQSGHSEDLQAENLEAAVEVVEEVVLENNESESKTYWVAVTLRSDDDDDVEERVVVTIPPNEPDCTGDDEHDWEDTDQCGTVFTETCRRCECKWITNTRDTNQETGESVRSEEYR